MKLNPERQGLPDFPTNRITYVAARNLRRAQAEKVCARKAGCFNRGGMQTTDATCLYADQDLNDKDESMRFAPELCRDFRTEFCQ